MADKQEPPTNVTVELEEFNLEARDDNRLDVETLLKENMKLKKEIARLTKGSEN